MALLVASNGCMGKKFKDLVTKICHFVDSDVIKVDFREFVMMSQGERKSMAEYTDNVEGHLSCDDSSHGEQYLRIPTAAIAFTVAARARNTVVAVETCSERSLSLNLLEPKTTLRLCILLLLVPKMVLILCNLRWCSFVRVHVRMNTFLQLLFEMVVVCGGDFT